MEKLKQAANADLAADVRLEKWAGTAHDDEEEEIEAPFEQTVDPSQLNFDFGRFEHPKKRNDDEDDSGSSECSESSSSDSYGQIDDTVLMEMQNLEHIFKNMGLNFRMIDRIGEGTFSTVYKAEDMNYNQYQNDWDTDPKSTLAWKYHPVTRRSRRCLPPPRVVRENLRRKPRYVAIKKIYVTSSPARIQNELELLHELRGCDSVCPLITAFRHQDQVVAVLPYFRHQDFRMFYREMNSYDIRVYFRSLFQALAAVHKHGIIHRDIKPTNFLYDVDRGQGVLVDFGLAEREGTDCSHCLCQETSASRREKIELSKAANQELPTGYPKHDQRPSRRANRAGTRGFRAPEVLLKCTAQTTKIDMWSAGVILLTILAQRFPFFNSADDVEAMIEIASIYGQKKMKACAILHGAVFQCTLPTIGDRGYTLAQIVQWSTSAIRPEDGDGLDQETKKIVRFLEALLELDPRKRFSARAALASEFLMEEEELGETEEEEEIDVLETS